MFFSVIYEFDTCKGESVRTHIPPNRRLWGMTESGPSEYDYLDEGRHPDNQHWSKGAKHRKFCAFLTRQQFERFVEHTNLFSEDVETMGSLGAMGFGFGLAPAISFTGDEDSCIKGAYVTPIPGRAKPHDPKHGPYSERAWQRLRRAVIKKYS